jgi:hypothetical protein
MPLAYFVFSHYVQYLKLRRGNTRTRHSAVEAGAMTLTISSEGLRTTDALAVRVRTTPLADVAYTTLAVLDRKTELFGFIAADHRLNRCSGFAFTTTSGEARKICLLIATAHQV